jgi:uncharacterized protein (TIGR02996 family)
VNKETERKAFLKALKKNEDDSTARLVYADWLDEHGEHEEADRMRKWDAAKKWIVKFCKKHNPPDEDDEDEWHITYADMIELGREAVANANKKAGESPFSCGNNMRMVDALQDNSKEFWKNWSIITGIPVTPDAEEKIYFACAC